MRGGILIAGYGGPDSPGAVAPFLRELTGREPSADLVARVTARYAAIGGSSPLLLTARELAGAVSAELAAAGTPLPVEVGMRYWRPYIADAVDALVSQGADRIALVSLSPYPAAITVDSYREALADALLGHPGVSSVEVPLLCESPVFVDLHCRAIFDALAACDVPGAPFVFTAHSLPAEEARRDDAYVRGLEAVVAQIAGRLGLAGGARCEPIPGVPTFGAAAGARPWLLAYQSRGARGGDWLGPDLDDVIRLLPAAGHRGVVVVPVGFVMDHMETLYDLDVVARSVAEEAGVSFVRSALPNADPRLACAIARAARELLDR